MNWRQGVFSALMIFFVSQTCFAQPHWPRFRGPNGSGIAQDSTAYPDIFDPKSNLLWRTPVAKGHSSLVIWGDRLFLTAQNDSSLETLCIDRRDGRILWQQIAPQSKPERVHRINSLASPSPTVDGERVYAYFGSYGVLCYDLDGELQWQRPFKKPLKNTFGVGSSLIVADDLLIFSCDNNEASFVEALDPATGEVIWRKDRTDFSSSWSTPMIRMAGNTQELLVYGVMWLTALDLRSGATRWSVPGIGEEPAITPVLGDSLVFVTSYNMKSNTEVIGLPSFEKLLETYDADRNGKLSFEEGEANKSVLSRFDADGEGDHPLRIFYRWLDGDKDRHIAKDEYQKLIDWVDSFKPENGLIAVRPPADEGDAAAIAWRYRYGVPEIPSPLYHDGRIYMVKNGGIFSCVDAKSGERIYQTRLGSGGPYYASPIAADGKIFTASARGVISTIAAGSQYKLIAHSDLSERIMATPALVQGRCYVRTEKAVYAFSTSENDAKPGTSLPR